MDSRSSRLAGFTTFPVLVVVLAFVVALAIAGTAGTADAQTTTKSIGVSGGTTVTSPNSTIPATPTTNGGTTDGDILSEFEQMLLSELQKSLTTRFPDSNQDDVNFMADLLLDFFMEHFFYNQLQQMNGPNTQR